MSTPRQVPDELWRELEPLLPAAPSHAKGGRRRADDRPLLDGMLHVWWTGCPWRALPRQVFGPWQTVYDRFAAWKRAGVFEQSGARCLQLYEGKLGLAGEGQSADGTFVRAPTGGKRSRPPSYGPRPTRLSRAGGGRGAGGGAERGEHRRPGERRAEALAGVELAPACPSPAQRVSPHHLGLEAAFDNAPARTVILLERSTGHIAPKGRKTAEAVVHPGGQARRWKVDRTHAWHDRFRRLVVNWEHTLASRYAFLCLAKALIACLSEVVCKHALKQTASDSVGLMECEDDSCACPGVP